MMSKPSTISSRMFIMDNASFPLINATLKILKSFLQDIQYVKQDLPCIKTVNFLTMEELVRNTVVHTKTLRKKTVHVIINVGTTAKKSWMHKICDSAR